LSGLLKGNFVEKFEPFDGFFGVQLTIRRPRACPPPGPFFIFKVGCSAAPNAPMPAQPGRITAERAPRLNRNRSLASAVWQLRPC